MLLRVVVKETDTGTTTRGDTLAKIEVRQSMKAEYVQGNPTH